MLIVWKCHSVHHLKMKTIHSLFRQTTPASSLCPQLCEPHPLWLQSPMFVSEPPQVKLSSQIESDPAPKAAWDRASAAPSYPSWRQTTWASFMSKSTSQTVPHCPSWYTSTLPSLDERPPTSRMSEKKTTWTCNWKLFYNFMFFLFDSNLFSFRAEVLLVTCLVDFCNVYGIIF